jgi:DNA processing protein
MNTAIFFKILQRRQKYRNPNHLLQLPSDFIYTREEYKDAYIYLKTLDKDNISYCYPGHSLYPEAFLKMQEPPLFLEYKGLPLWTSYSMMAVVGSREIEDSTERWMRHHLAEFLKRSTSSIAIVSGGARGVDQLSHNVAIKEGKPTIVVLPTGLNNMYPSNLDEYLSLNGADKICFMSEFESNQKILRANFYFRNRLIAALARFTLVTQATLKSGSMLTVHHCLANGRPVVSVPAHPEMSGFQGNVKLIQEGAYIISSFHDLLDFWMAESSSNWT